MIKMIYSFRFFMFRMSHKRKMRILSRIKVPFACIIKNLSIFELILLWIALRVSGYESI